MRFKMLDRRFKGSNDVAEMMEASAPLYGVRYFTSGPVRRDQFEVGPLSAQLQKLHMRGLQWIMDHGRCR